MAAKTYEILIFGGRSRNDRWGDTRPGFRQQLSPVSTWTQTAPFAGDRAMSAPPQNVKSGRPLLINYVI